MVKLDNWLGNQPHTTGRDLVDSSFLGPFLCTSGFPEEDTRVVERLLIYKMSYKPGSLPNRNSKEFVAKILQEVKCSRIFLQQVSCLHKKVGI